jgi:hypothetical protein
MPRRALRRAPPPAAADLVDFIDVDDTALGAQRLFEMEGVDLTVAGEALGAIARKAIVIWLEMPELEAQVTAADSKPASLGLLRECVEAIATATERRVKIEPSGSYLRIRNQQDKQFNVTVRDGEYYGYFQQYAERSESVVRHTAKLSWEICGFMCTPAEMRDARDRARRDGITESIPLNYFDTAKKL